MEVAFTKEEILSFIKKYYLEFENKNVSVDVEIVEGYTYYREVPGCELKFVVSEEIVIGDLRKEAKYKFSEEELENKLTMVLGSYGYNLLQVLLQYGVRDITSGYGTIENVNKETYFDGVTVQLERKEDFQKTFIDSDGKHGYIGK